MFVQISNAQTIIVTDTQTTQKWDEVKKYKHTKLKFSVEIPQIIRVEESPSGFVLGNPFRESQQLFLFISSYSKMSADTADLENQQYKRLKNVKIGETIKDDMLGLGTFSKIENLRVDGYPAFKVKNEYNSQESKGGRGVGSFYVINVYFKRGNDLWVISYSPVYNQKQKEEEVFEGVLKTFMFTKS